MTFPDISLAQRREEGPLRLRIKHQPQASFRQRYLSEMKKTTHGVLKSNYSNTFSPTVSMTLNAAECQTIKIFCLLYDDPVAGILSNRLLFKGKEAIYEPVALEFSGNEGSEYHFVLKDYAIVIPKKEANSCEQILTKLATIPDWHTKIKRGGDEAKGSKDVYLGFAACKTQSDGCMYELIEGPIFSNPIRAKMCRVNKLCNPNIPLHLGGEMNLLMHEVQKDSEYEIKLVHIENCKTIWENDIPKQSVKKYVTNNAISFEVPPYGYMTNEQQIKCAMRINDATPVVFYYTYLPAKPLEDVKRRKIATDSTQNTQEEVPKLSDINELFFFKPIPDILHSNEKFSMEYGYPLFFQAIMNDALPSGSTQLQSIYKTTSNNEGQNLLHYACKENKYKPLRYLSELDGLLTKWDRYQQTPLHIAIDMGNRSCIDEFTRIYNNPKTITETLKQLFDILNGQCYSVLHLAVLHDEQALVESMLKFCKLHKIDVRKLIEPKYGDTIIQLAKGKKLTEMEKLICDILPEAKTYTNYEARESAEVVEEEEEE